MFHKVAVLALVFAAFAPPALASPTAGISITGSSTRTSGTSSSAAPSSTSSSSASSSTWSSSASSSTWSSATSSSSSSAPASTDTTSPYYNRTIGSNIPWGNLIRHDPNDPPNASLWFSVLVRPTFIWVDSVAMIANLDNPLITAQVHNHSIVQLVIYDMPNRYCSSNAQPGDFTFDNDGQAQYFNFIDQLVAKLQEYPTVKVVAIIEPNSLAAVAANPSLQACRDVIKPYSDCVAYAVQQLSSVPLTQLYIDAGNAALIPDLPSRSNMATLINQIFSATGSPSAIRGLATNVGGYNSYNSTTAEAIFAGNPVYNEKLYAHALVPGLSHPVHFIVDQSRSGQPGIRTGLGDWCNVAGAGLGVLPTTATGAPLFDALVWAANPGESDGTSDPSSPNFDPACARADSETPAPEYFQWFSSYFYTLVFAANPAIQPF